MTTTELPDPDEWPDPEETAAEYISRFDGESEGVRRDGLVDTFIEMDEHAYQIQQSIVQLDSIIDSQMAPMPVIESVSTIKSHQQELLDWMEEFNDELKDALDEME